MELNENIKDVCWKDCPYRHSCCSDTCEHYQIRTQQKRELQRQIRDTQHIDCARFERMRKNKRRTNR